MFGSRYGQARSHSRGNGITTLLSRGAQGTDMVQVDMVLWSIISSYMSPQYPGARRPSNYLPSIIDVTHVTERCVTVTVTSHCVTHACDAGGGVIVLYTTTTTTTTRSLRSNIIQ